MVHRGLWLKGAAGKRSLERPKRTLEYNMKTDLRNWLEECGSG